MQSSSKEKSTTTVKKTKRTTTVSVERGPKGDIGVCQDHILELAEQCYEEILKQLANAEGDVKSASAAFERLVNLLLQLGGQNEELKTRISQTASETQELESQFEEQRSRLTKVLKQFPPDVLPSHKSHDPLSSAAAVNNGVSNLLQSLVKSETEDSLLKKTIADHEKEIEDERKRFEEVKKVADQALSVFKSTFPDAADVGSIGDMVGKLRQMIEEERRGKADATKQLDLCKQIIDQMKWEFADVGKILEQLFSKCAEIDRAMVELGLEGGKVPSFRPDGDEAEQFNSSLAWLMDAIDRLITELRTSKKRLSEAEAERQKYDAVRQKMSENLKQAMEELASLNVKMQATEGQLRGEKSAREATTKIMEEHRLVNERHLKRLKQLCEDEQARSNQMADLLQKLLNELNAALERMKKDQAAGVDGDSPLAKKIEQVLAELEKLQLQYGDDSKTQDERAQQLEREEEEMNARLEKARDRLKAAKDKRAAMAEELQKVKAELNTLLQSEHEMEQQLGGFNEERIQTQAEIAKLKLSNDQLREKADSGQRSLEMKDKLLQDLLSQQENAEKAIKDLEKENDRLKWTGEGPAPSALCSKCEGTGDLQQKADTLRSAISNAKQEMEQLLSRIEKETLEVERLKIARSIGTSQSSVQSGSSSPSTDGARQTGTTTLTSRPTVSGSADVAAKDTEVVAVEEIRERGSDFEEREEVEAVGGEREGSLAVRVNASVHVSVDDEQTTDE